MQENYQVGPMGKKRPVAQPNYHMLTNNAVFPVEDSHQVIHQHTKKTRDNGLRLAPTIR